MPISAIAAGIAELPLITFVKFFNAVKNITGKHLTHYFLGGMTMTKHTKKDGGTKQQKNKNQSSKKSSSSANGSNGYH